MAEVNDRKFLNVVCPECGHKTVYFDGRVYVSGCLDDQVEGEIDLECETCNKTIDQFSIT